ncbi:acyl-CoA thioesterase II [Acuticoccus sp. MNP-M23]|uniref:acyl-CoA thioesterase II n=1 Tax=Acuticoccus sp. MNP-M23 TaxID=3072793 RepID=UPI002814F23B|nr:acyl-CoA thioesterase II [Acuticoccus sp. MNP-M23]WMS41159.1 acyl-CoA thioesterase II [Acuticoccus sp. MNP-M23]
MRPAVAELLKTLDLEPLEVNLFRGESPQVGWQRVFGGQVIGQALVAATRTVAPERQPHSLHGYFMRPGDPSVPIIYEVTRLRDGRSFATRLVVGIQHGEAIFSMSVSYHLPEDGLEHMVAMPDVPGPDELPDEAELRETFLRDAPDAMAKYFQRERPIEMRPLELRHYTTNEKLPPRQYIWVRATDRLPDDPQIHQAVLAYLSDMTLFDTALFVHGLSVFNRTMQVASLDHAMWFHRPFRADEWLLYAQDSPSSGGARGFTRGLIYAQDGRLVASTAQEGLMRKRTR